MGHGGTDGARGRRLLLHAAPAAGGGGRGMSEPVKEESGKARIQSGIPRLDFILKGGFKPGTLHRDGAAG